jgi:hypothetical protein
VQSWFTCCRTYEHARNWILYTDEFVNIDYSKIGASKVDDFRVGDFDAVFDEKGSLKKMTSTSSSEAQSTLSSIKNFELCFKKVFFLSRSLYTCLNLFECRGNVAIVRHCLLRSFKRFWVGFFEWCSFAWKARAGAVLQDLSGLKKN